MDEKQFYTIIIRHDSSTNWAVNNPILSYGEYAVEDDTHRVKRGDGETSWNSLPYEDFGLNYIVTFSNLNGEVIDNPQLVSALKEKLDVGMLEDVGYKVLTEIEIREAEDVIAKITKFNKNINTGLIDQNIMYIKSTDMSIEGYWSVDGAGAKILNLSSKATIGDYKPGQTYRKDFVCFYRNRLYRAIEDFEAERDFNPNHWVALSSKQADDIAYNNNVSELNSENVQDAIDETNRRIDNRVVKTDETNRVYGTSNNGAQITIPISDLYNIHSVNGKRPDVHEKNIQLDANDINYNDENSELGTVKTVLDKKLDKTFVGGDNLLVNNVQFNYNPNTGKFEFVEQKVSLLDGSHPTERVEIDVVSEEELRGEVLALNNQIGTVENNLITLINTKTGELNTRITEEVSTLNNTISQNVSTLDTKIDTEKADVLSIIDTKDTIMDTKKIDKDVATTLVSNIEVAPYNSNPTLKFTNKNTTTKETTYNYVHFTTSGTLVARIEDVDHIVIDSSAIDNLNTQQDIRITTAENRLNAHDTNIAILMEHDVNHDSAILLNSQQIAHHETRIVALESGLVTANSNIELESANRIAEDTALSGRITENTVGITAKVDKSFANILDNKILGKVELDDIVNTELLNLKQTFISPFDSSLSTSNLKVTSSNGTIVAEKLLDGTIDLTAHVNLDVNYYVTSETISNVIADETTIHLSSLTPSGREINAGRDVISDANNTYGRVQSVNLLEGTCVVLTFQKSTQVTWGNIGGTLANQIDLKSALDTKLESVNGKSTTALSKAITLDATEINVDETAQTKVTIKTKLDDLNDNKVSVTLDANKVYGTDNQGNATTYNVGDFGNVNTVNGVSPDSNKDVTVGTSDISSVNMLGDTTTLALVITELQDKITDLTEDLQGQIRPYAVNTQYTTSGNFITQKYVTLYNGVSLLVAKVLRDFTSDNTQATIIDSFIYDVEHDNLLLVGIPEEVAND